MIAFVLKPRKCASKACRKAFMPERPGQLVCTWECGRTKIRLDGIAAIERREKREAKRLRMEKRVGLERLMTRSDWLRRAQAAFNSYIRARDRDQKCISCERPLEGKFDAGHLLSVGSHPELRFNEDNCHGQCVHCNQWKSGSPLAYRARLIDRIGLQRVEVLEAPHEAQKLAVTQIMALAAKYRTMTKQLQKQRDATA